MWAILACTNIEENNLVSESSTEDNDNDDWVLIIAVKDLMNFADHYYFLYYEH